jgi:hypothetical protein
MSSTSLSKSTSRKALNGRGMSFRHNTALPLTSTLNQPLRGFSAFRELEVSGFEAFTLAKTLFAIRPNKPQVLHASISTSTDVSAAAGSLLAFFLGGI